MAMAWVLLSGREGLVLRVQENDTVSNYVRAVAGGDREDRRSDCFGCELLTDLK